MKVVVAHNWYASGIPSGENAVVEFEVAALRARGLEVTTLFRRSDDIPAGALGRLRLAPSPTHNQAAVRELRDMILRSRPDVVHVHNLFPLLSPSILRTASDAGIATVATMHNHRWWCMAGTLRRDGRPCLDCVDGPGPVPGVIHACYRGSRAQSVAMGAALSLRRRTLQGVGRYIALSDEIASHLADYGVPRSRIDVKPNTVDDPGPSPAPGDRFLFVGRLTEEKGVLLLLDAWRRAPEHSRGRLVIAGDGPLRRAVEAAASDRHDVDYRGTVDAAGVHDLMTHCGAVVVPSLWSEAFPRVVAEALVRGRGVLATPMGSLPEIIGDGGWVAEATVDAWDAALTRIAGSADLRVAAGSAARRQFERRYARDVVMDQLIDIYRKAQGIAS